MHARPRNYTNAAVDAHLLLPRIIDGVWFNFVTPHRCGV